MKSIFIIYEQSYNMDVADMLYEKFSCRGYTMWNNVMGRGTKSGEPHEGSHAWPVLNSAILTFVPDDKVDEILAEIKMMDEETPALGLRAFVWGVEKSY